MNTDVKKYLNLLFNPTATKNLPFSADSSETANTLKHMGGLAVGYGGLGLLARQLVKAKEDAQKAPSSKKLESYLRAKNPVLSLDSSTRDDKREEELQTLGASPIALSEQLGKEASVIGDGTKNAAALAAALTSLYGGYRLMDNKIDSDRVEELEKSNIDAENDIDKMLLERYYKTRQKEASQSLDLDTVLALQFPATEKTASDDALENILARKGAGNRIQSAGTAGAGMMALYSLASGALAYKAARSYWDKADDSRARVRQLRKILQEKSKVRTAPQFTDLSDIQDSSPTNAQPSKTSPSTVEMQRQSDIRNPASKTTTPVDSTDPYAALLQ